MLARSQTRIRVRQRASSCRSPETRIGFASKITLGGGRTPRSFRDQQSDQKRRCARQVGTYSSKTPRQKNPHLKSGHRCQKSRAPTKSALILPANENGHLTQLTGRPKAPLLPEDTPDQLPPEKGGKPQPWAGRRPPGARQQSARRATPAGWAANRTRKRSGSRLARRTSPKGEPMQGSSRPCRGLPPR